MTQESYPGFRSQIPKRNKSILERILTRIWIIPVAAIVLVPLYFFLSSVLFPKDIEGTLLDLTYIPGSNGKSGKIWIQTDGSFSYISKSTSGGSTSTGRKGLFCKTYSIIYDPEQKKVLQKIKTPYDELPPPQNVFYKDGKVWVVSKDFSGTEPIINIYDSETAALVSDTKDFISKHKELSSGMSTLRVDEDPKRFSIATHDGQTVVYSVDKDMVFENEQALKNADQIPGDGIVSIFMLASDQGLGARKNLYKVTGPYSQIVAKGVSQNSLRNAESLKFTDNAVAEMLTPEKIYLEGIILYQDTEMSLILHQSQIGKNADRMLTCVDLTGKERWNAGQSQLFKDMAVTEKDAFSEIFFMKDKFKVERSGNVIIFKFNPSGVIGFDAITGKKLWTLEI